MQVHGDGVRLEDVCACRGTWQRRSLGTGKLRQAASAEIPKAACNSRRRERSAAPVQGRAASGITRPSLLSARVHPRAPSKRHGRMTVLVRAAGSESLAITARRSRCAKRTGFPRLRRLANRPSAPLARHLESARGPAGLQSERLPDGVGIRWTRLPCSTTWRCSCSERSPARTRRHAPDARGRQRRREPRRRGVGTTARDVPGEARGVSAGDLPARCRV